MNVIGHNIKRFREQQNLTQGELAARCNVNGWDISRGTLAKIEAKVRRITDIEIIQVANALKVPIQELFEIDDLNNQ